MRTILEVKSDIEEVYWLPQDEKWDMAGQKFQVTVKVDGITWTAKSISMEKARNTIKARVKEMRENKIMVGHEKEVEKTSKSVLYPRSTGEKVGA